MSNVRIRYEDYNHREGCKISINTFISSRTGARYKVILDLNEMTYYIRNERTKEFVKRGNKYTNLNVLKRYARKSLVDKGVNLKKESRWRTFGRCEKEWSQDKQLLLENNKN